MKPYYPVGRYACKITGQALSEAKTGNPQFVMQFKVMGQVDPEDPTKYIPAQQQYERTFYRTITEKTIDYFVEDLKTLGFNGHSFSQLNPDSSGFVDLRGLDVDMWCAHEATQDGRGEREKWSVALQGAPEIKATPLEAKKARQLDDLFGKHLRQLRPSETKTEPLQSKPQPTASTQSQYQPEDEDCPF